MLPERIDMPIITQKPTEGTTRKVLFDPKYRVKEVHARYVLPELHYDDVCNLRSSGLSNATIRENEFRTEGDRLVIPYRRLLDGKIIDFYRWRNPEGSENKYGQKPGSAIHAYFPSASVDRICNTNQPILITEGEKKAALLAQHGYAAVGLCGVWGGFKGRSQKEKDDKKPKRLLDELAQLSWRGREVCIVFDSDPKQKTKDDVERAATELSAALSKKDVGATVRIVRLPASPDGTKVGVDDFVVANGIEVFRDLIDPPISAFTMADARKIVNSITYLVPAAVPFGMITGVVGPAGHGKSAFVLGSLVRDYVLGAETWFNGTINTNQPGKILMCDTDNNMALNLERLEEWQIPDELLVLPFEGLNCCDSICLDNAEHLLLIERKIKENNCRLVIVDTLRGAHGGDENDSKIEAKLKSLADIAGRTNSAIVVVHHTKKPKPGEKLTANSSRGSSAIVAKFKSQLGVEKTSEDPNDTVIKIEMLKRNIKGRWDPVAFEITDDGLRSVPVPAATSNYHQTDKGEAKSWLLVNMERGKEYHSKELMLAAKNMEGIQEHTLRRAYKALNGVTPWQARNEQGFADKWMWKLPSAG